MKKIKESILTLLCMFIICMASSSFADAIPKAFSACEKIIKATDSSTDEVKYTAPPVGIKYSVTLRKSIEDGIAVYSVSLALPSNSRKLSAFGIVITFDDGTIFKKDSSELTLRPKNGKFEYGGSIATEESGFMQFTSKKIKNIKLDNNTAVVPNSDSRLIQEYAGCLLGLK